MSQSQSPATAKRKTSTEQLNILVDFIDNNRILLHGKTKPSEAASNEVEKLWDELTALLNSCGSGPAKLKNQWKKTFVDWKCHTRKKARDIQSSSTTTGGGPGSQKQLTPVEEKLMGISTWISVKGNEDVDELGMADPISLNIREIPDHVPDLGGQTIETEERACSLQTPERAPKRSFLQMNAGLEDRREDSFVKTRPNSSSNKGESTLQRVVEMYAAAQKLTREVAEIGTTQILPPETLKRQLDQKDEELKIRLLEAKNRQKELELWEREIVLKENEAKAKKHPTLSAKLNIL